VPSVVVAVVELQLQVQAVSVFQAKQRSLQPVYHMRPDFASRKLLAKILCGIFSKMALFKPKSVFPTHRGYHI
jgi:hypothetical protein